MGAISAAVEFVDLPASDLVPGCVYRAGPSGQLADEPIAPLLKVGNMGGIRPRGAGAGCDLIVLYSTLGHRRWTDSVDRRSGVVSYHGDNETPGTLMQGKGNRLLRSVFELGFADETARRRTPPFFVFTTPTEGVHPSRTVEFLGLAVPGAVTLPDEDWLVSKWFDIDGRRFENYVLSVTLLDVPSIPRAWIADLATDRLGSSCPPAYRHWVVTGRRRSSGSVG